MRRWAQLAAAFALGTAVYEIATAADPPPGHVWVQQHACTKWTCSGEAFDGFDKDGKAVGAGKCKGVAGQPVLDICRDREGTSDTCEQQSVPFLKSQKCEGEYVDDAGAKQACSAEWFKCTRTFTPGGGGNDDDNNHSSNN